MTSKMVSKSKSWKPPPCPNQQKSSLGNLASRKNPFSRRSLLFPSHLSPLFPSPPCSTACTVSPVCTNTHSQCTPQICSVSSRTQSRCSTQSPWLPHTHHKRRMPPLSLWEQLSSVSTLYRASSSTCSRLLLRLSAPLC